MSKTSLKPTKIEFHPAIDNYICAVESGEIIAGKYIKDLMVFVRNKLKDAVIKSDVIDRAITTMNKHFEEPTLPWQDFLTAFIFGVYDKDGLLMFNEFLVYMGRGAGKTGYMSRLELALASVEGHKKYHVDIVATSEDQAKESFNDIWEILDEDKRNNGGRKYKRYFYFTKEQIIFRPTNSRIRYRTNNAKTKDGGRQGVVIFDEVHAYEDESNIKVFVSGLGKRPKSRRFYFTTDGYNRGGFLDQLKSEVPLILNGDRPNRKTLPLLFAIDEKDEIHNPDMWEKANPSLRYFPHLKQEMLDEYEKLSDRGGSEVEFMTKRMNFPINAINETVTTWENIQKANDDLPELRGTPAVVGVDYADTNDFVVVGLLMKKENVYFWKSHTFICHLALEGRKYKVPIDVAVEEGRATIVYEDIISPSYPVGWVLEQAKQHPIVTVTSDMYRINYLSEEFEKNGLDRIKIARSGSLTHTALDPFVGEIFAFERIKWGKDFMMNWYTWNTYKKRDGKGNMTYEKIEPKLRKNDGFMALIHALQHREELNVPEVKINRRLRTYNY